MLEDESKPLMANRGQTPYIPTGYEGIQASARRKRQIGEALMAKGLAGPGDNVRSWAQALASLAQTWAGKSIQKAADKLEAESQAKMQQEIAAAKEAYANRPADMSPDQVLRTFGSNPWLKDEVRSYEAALAAKLKNDQEFGAPVEVKKADGTYSTGVFNKSGEGREVSGGLQLPPKVEIVNGVAINPTRMAAGTVAPQDFSKKVITGPDGKALANQLAIDADTKVAAAGAANSKIVVEGNQDANKAGLAVIEESFKKAQGAKTSLSLIDNVRRSLDTGKVSSGPLSDVKSFIERLTGTNKDGLSNRRTVEQSLAQGAIAARPQMGSGTSISMGEQKLVNDAALGDITKFTNEELYATAKAIEKLSLETLEGHSQMISRARSSQIPYGPALDLFDIKMPERYIKPTVKRKVPRTPRKGLPPKGVGTKPAVKSEYSDLFPPPAGGR